MPIRHVYAIYACFLLQNMEAQSSSTIAVPPLREVQLPAAGAVRIAIGGPLGGTVIIGVKVNSTGPATAVAAEVTGTTRIVKGATIRSIAAVSHMPAERVQLSGRDLLVTKSSTPDSAVVILLNLPPAMTLSVDGHDNTIPAFPVTEDVLITNGGVRRQKVFGVSQLLLAAKGPAVMNARSPTPSISRGEYTVDLQTLREHVIQYTQIEAHPASEHQPKTLYLKLKISPEGNVQSLEGSGYSALTSQGVRAAMSWRFRPFLVGRESVAATGIVPIVVGPTGVLLSALDPATKQAE